MRKLMLDIDTFDVQSFDTAAAVREHGTVVANAKPATVGCGSEIDACPSALGCTLFQCDTTYCTAAECPATYDAQQCPSAVDACPSGRGCTQVGGC